MAQYKHYSKDFKLQAARLVTEHGYSLKDAAQKLGVSAWSIRYWIKKFQLTAELPAQNQTQPAADEIKPPRLLRKQQRGQGKRTAADGE
jgi:transposase-like protein